MTKHKNLALDELRILAALMVLAVHTGQKVGLVVLGSGRKRLVYAVAGGDCADALTGGH